MVMGGGGGEGCRGERLGVNVIGVEIWILSSNVDTKCLMPVTIKEEIKKP